MLSLLRFIGALIGWYFGFFLAISLLEISDISAVTSKLLVVFLIATLCAILGWLGTPYVTVKPASFVKARIHEASAGDLAGGAFGAGVGLVLALFLAFPLSFLPGEIGRFAPVAAATLLGVVGAVAGSVKRHEIIGFARELRAGKHERTGDARVLVDTSVIIDGRIADVVKTGFVRGTLLIPRFILAELQYFADSSDNTKRERGRRGLELLSRLQKDDAGVRVELTDADPPENGADAKLVALARTLGVPLVTNDYGLDRVAQLQGVAVLNMNELAKAVRPVLLPGEEMTVRVIQEGREPAQGIGYLDDGTMVVVENGSRHVGNDVDVAVMRVLQTAGGRMIFAQPKGETPDTRRPRAAVR